MQLFLVVFLPCLLVPIQSAPLSVDFQEIVLHDGIRTSVWDQTLRWDVTVEKPEEVEATKIMVPGENQDFMMGQVEIKPKPALEVQVEKIDVPAMDVEVEKIGMSGLDVEVEKLGVPTMDVEVEKLGMSGLVVEEEKFKLDFPAHRKEAEEIQVQLSLPNHKQEVLRNEEEVTQPGGILVEQAKVHDGLYIVLIWCVWILVVVIVHLL